MSIDTLILISVGNTRARVARARALAGTFSPQSLEPSRVVEHAAVGQLEEAIRAAAAGASTDRTQVLIASVNDTQLPRISSVCGSLGLPLARLAATESHQGPIKSMRVPVATDLTGPITTGVDRLLNVLAAYSRSGGHACCVIDAGTAVTVDYIDAHGIFQGGLITPGLTMMLGSLHAGTAALPTVTAPRSKENIPAGPCGKTTVDAMTLGAITAIQGLAHVQIDRCAENAGAYPRVIATGGDAPILFEDDPLIEHIVPDLSLIGMLTAWQIISGAAGHDVDSHPSDSADLVEDDA